MPEVLFSNAAFLLPSQIFESRGTCIIYLHSQVPRIKADTPRELVELSAYEDYSHKSVCVLLWESAPCGKV